MKNPDMEKIRQKLNDMIISKDVKKDELLKMSRELDKLILKSMAGKEKNPSRDSHV